MNRQAINTFGVSFFLKKYLHDPSKGVIYMRLIVNGKRLENSAKMYAQVDTWDPGKGRFKELTPELAAQNQQMEHMKAKAWTIFRSLLLDCEIIDVSMLRNKLMGIDEERKSLLTAFNYHLNTETLVLAQGTLKNYHTTEKYIRLFLTTIKKRPDIPLKSINFQFITEFEHFLRSYQPTDHRKKMTNNGLMKHMERLQKVLNMAHKLDWMTERPMDKYRLSFTKKDRGYLDVEELAILELNPMPCNRLEMVRDLFIFACYSGLSYIDLYHLKPSNLVLGIDGEYWIRTKRQKSNENVIVPILPKALEMIQKYKGDPRSLANGTVFPPISNQKMNAFLKEIAEICGIFKHLTFHLARHTFATTITLSNGVPIETVSKMLGHTKISTTQIYSKVVERKVSEDMMALRQKLNQTETKPLRRLG